MNHSFIALIPKKKGATIIRDYRPISLLSSVYKIIDKVLASRRRLVMNSLISNSQGEFFKGRHILDGILVANECVDDMEKPGRNDILCKLDLENSYDDQMNWNFLDYMMGRMGFGKKWRNWMMMCITSISFSMLVRQGDPLSLYLLIMVGE